MSQDVERTLEALIDAELLSDAESHAHAVKRTIDGSGLPLAARLQLLERLNCKMAELAKAPH